MGITILKDLPAVVGVRNDIWMKVQLSTGVKLLVQVYYHTTVLTTLRMSVDSANTVSFNLKRILQAVGDPGHTIDIDLPGFNSSGLTFCQQIIKYFSVKLIELAPDDTEVTNTTISSIALLAGLNPELSYTRTLLSYLQGPPRKFLTNKPSRKLTGRDTQEYLYYYNTNPENNLLDLVLKIYFDDGTDSGEIVVVTDSVVCAIFPAGYSQLSIDAHVPTGKNVLYYEVYINDNAIPTEKHQYEIDDRCYPDGRQFIFKNSLGGMDSLRVQDLDEIDIQKDGETVERFVGIDSLLTSGQYYEYNVLSTRQMKATTIPSQNDERRWLQEFFASDRIFEINNGRFLPVRITSTSMVTAKKASDYLAVDFTYVYRFDDIGFTKQ